VGHSAGRLLSSAGASVVALDSASAGRLLSSAGASVVALDSAACDAGWSSLPQAARRAMVARPAVARASRRRWVGYTKLFTYHFLDNQIERRVAAGQTGGGNIANSVRAIATPQKTSRFSRFDRVGSRV
jgi:hypothetical protein